MSANDEITLEDIAKKDGKNQSNNGKFGNKKGRLGNKLNGIKKGIRRTGNGSFNKGKIINQRRKNSNNFIKRDQNIRSIPEHKKRIVKVYNLAPEITNDDFYALFVKYGMIEKASIDVDQKGKSLEKGTVVYREHEAAKRAIEDLNNVDLESRIITVEFMKDGETISGRPKIIRGEGKPGIKKRGMFKKNNGFRKNSNGSNGSRDRGGFKRKGFRGKGNRRFNNNNNNNNNN